MPSVLVVKGDIRKLKARRNRKRNGAAISTTFRGNARAALSTTNTRRTLGASNRQPWRLSCTPAERLAAGVTGVTRNTAEYVAYNGVLGSAFDPGNVRTHSPLLDQSR